MKRLNIILFIAGAAFSLLLLIPAVTAMTAGWGHGKRLQGMNLTPDQQTKAQQIFQQAREQVLQVLTPEQRDALKSAHGSPSAAFQSLNLSDDQKARIKAIHDDARAKAQAIKDNSSLSDADKRAQLRDLRQATRGSINPGS